MIFVGGHSLGYAGLKLCPAVYRSIDLMNIYVYIYIHIHPYILTLEVFWVSKYPKANQLSQHAKWTPPATVIYLYLYIYICIYTPILEINTQAFPRNGMLPNT